MLNKTNITEFSGAVKVLEFRKVLANFQGLSFGTISSIGPNGSVIHYEPHADNCKVITNKEVYLLDSGCQYL